jgi:hypothetical protein
MPKPSALSDFAVTKPGVPKASAPKPDTSKASDPQLKRMVVRVPVEASRQLKQLKVDTDTSLQDLMAEGLNLLFEKHGLPQIA